MQISDVKMEVTADRYRIDFTYVDGRGQPRQELHNGTDHPTAVSDRSHGEHCLDLVLVFWQLGCHDEESGGALAVPQIKQFLLVRDPQDVIYYRRKIVCADLVPAAGKIRIVYFVFSALPLPSLPRKCIPAFVQQNYEQAH